MGDPSNSLVTRREFLGAVAATVGAARVDGAEPAAAKIDDDWSFALLGDTHFDRLEHHDHAWLAREQPGDVAQVTRYSEHTATLLPPLFEAVRAKVAAAPGRFDFVDSWRSAASCRPAINGPSKNFRVSKTTARS